MDSDLVMERAMKQPKQNSSAIFPGSKLYEEDGGIQLIPHGFLSVLVDTKI